MSDQKSSSNFAENWLRWSSGQINFRNFGIFATFFAKSEKNPISSLKFGKFLDFFFKIPLLQRPFFSKKNCLRSCSKLAQMKFRENKFSQFSSFLILLKKCWKKSESSSKFWIFFSKSHCYRGLFFQNFPWELLVKWTRIKFKGNSLYFFSRRSEKKIQKISL